MSREAVLPRNLVAQVVLRLKIPPVGRNDTVSKVTLQTSKSRIICDRLIII